ncbi:hypothetical protein KJ700_02515, partial [Patescibacteria group bacterium]|nr:hypothetical protein [Patescibacteria group bacterium]
MKLKIFCLFFFVFGIVPMASAQELSQSSISSVISAFRSYKDVSNISINVPTVVEVPFLDDFIERFDFAVFDKTTNSFEPHFFKQEINKTVFSVNTNPSINSANLMNDNNTQTYADFSLPENEQGHAQIVLSSVVPITSSVLTTLLDNNVALPSFVEIRAFVDGQSRIVVANQRMDQQTIHFPQTTSNEWTISFTFGQPLRISELRFNQDNITINARAIRFLAQPAHSYRIYFDSDRSVMAPVGEAGNLVSAEDIFVVSAILSQNNPNYIIADVDGDGVADIRDNCVS